MKHCLVSEIFQLFVANLANSPTIGCDWRLDLKNFRYNLVVPELIKRLLSKQLLTKEEASANN